jgi:hypothetical protein
LLDVSSDSKEFVKIACDQAEKLLSYAVTPPELYLKTILEIKDEFGLVKKTKKPRGDVINKSVQQQAEERIQKQYESLPKKTTTNKKANTLKDVTSKSVQQQAEERIQKQYESLPKKTTTNKKANSLKDVISKSVQQQAEERIQKQYESLPKKTTTNKKANSLKDVISKSIQQQAEERIQKQYKQAAETIEKPKPKPRKKSAGLKGGVDTRLAKLKELEAKALITKKEAAEKRKEILEDL